MRSIRLFLAFSCLTGMLLSSSASAQNFPTLKTRSSSLLEEIGKRTEAHRFLGLVRVQRFFEVLPFLMEQVKKSGVGAQIDAASAQMFLSMTGIDFRQGMVLLVQRSQFPWQWGRFDISLWMRLQRPQILSSLSQMAKMRAKGKLQLFHHKDASGDREAFLIQTNQRKSPWFCLLRQGNLVLLRPVPKPRLRGWMGSLALTEWSQTVLAQVSRSLTLAARPLASQKMFLRYRRRQSVTQLSLLLNARELTALLLRQVLRRMGPFEQILRQRLAAVSMGLAIRQQTIYVRESILFAKGKNPLMPIMAPSTSKAQTASMLPKTTMFLSQGNLHLQKIWPYVQQLAGELRIPPRRLKRMALQFAQLRQRLISHIGSDPQTQLFPLLTGQYATALVMKDPHNPPLLTSHKGMVMMLGTTNGNKLRNLLLSSLAQLQQKQVVMSVAKEIHGKRVYELAIPNQRSLFWAVERGFWVLSSDLETLGEVLKTTPANSLASRFATSMKNLGNAQSHNRNHTFVDLTALRPWLMNWQIPASDRRIQRLLAFRKQLLQAGTGTMVSDYKPSSINIAWKLRLNSSNAPVAPAPHKTVPHISQDKKMRGHAAGFGVVSLLPGLFTPSLGVVGAVGGAAFYFFRRAMKRGRSNGMRSQPLPVPLP